MDHLTFIVYSFVEISIGLKGFIYFFQGPYTDDEETKDGFVDQKIALDFYQPDTVTPVFVGDIQPFVIADKLTSSTITHLQ